MPSANLNSAPAQDPNIKPLSLNDQTLRSLFAIGQKAQSGYRTNSAENAVIEQYFLPLVKELQKIKSQG